MKKVLIVVDMLNDFCHKDGVLAISPITNELYAKSAIDTVKTKVEEYRSNNDVIIWLADSHDENDKEFDRFPPHAIRDTWGGKVIDELRPEEINNSTFEMLMPKTRYSGFYGTDLEYQLMRLNPDLVEVVGVCTSICVMDTVGGLANRDYKVKVYKDGVADFDPAGHEAALARMSGLYGAEIV